jgi:hypothetical protein
MAETRRMHHGSLDGEDKWTETKVKQLVDSKSLAPRDKGTDEPIGENLDECPICFAYFPMLNSTCCCNKVRKPQVGSLVSVIYLCICIGDMYELLFTHSKIWKAKELSIL